MNFKIQQTYPSPPSSLSPFNTLTYAQHINSLVLYGEQKGQAQAASQQPKKKIAFKADKSAQITLNDKISVYSITDRKWESYQGQGKIPPPRTDFQAIYMKPCVVIYGGKSGTKLLNDVYALNCENWTWKKLFSLDGPPPAEDFTFFSISSQTAGLIAASTLWLLQLVDVKWELTANELPGSVWQKLNIQMPEKVKICWPLDNSELLVVGQTQAIKINLIKKQITAKLRPLQHNLWENTQIQKQGRKKLFNFYDKIKVDKMSENGPLLAYSVSSLSIRILKFTDTISPISEKEDQSKIQLQRPVKCCALVNSTEERGERFIFYLDQKCELLSVSMCPEFDQEPRTSRAIEEKRESVIRSNSCILEQQENEDSSMLIPSTSSRLNISSNQRIKEAALIQDDNHIENSEGSLADSRVQNRQDSHEGYKTKKEESKWKKDQANFIENKRTNNLLITDEQPESGSSKPKQETSRKNIYNINNSQTNPTERESHHEKFKQEERERENKMEQGKSLKMYQERNGFAEKIQLKIKLDNILYSESVKRKLLQSKVDALESLIKKSEKFVLKLCKYGSESEKQRHIERVREIRQQLEANWSKQIYYRREMEMNKMPSQISQQIQQTMNHIQY